MANKYFNSQIWPGEQSGGKGAAPKPGLQQGSGGKGSFKEKPAFPKADLPGKSQPKDRSGGVEKLKIDPKRLGL